MAALDLAASCGVASIDVRSEGEFAQGSIPGFHNGPILNDAERHQVGLCYKEQGQAAAIALGERLVGPVIEKRVAEWQALARATGNEAVVTCWRGGLRSQLACQQLAAAGCRTLRVAGGYKAMRHELLKTLAAPPSMLVVGGLTGSGKTRLLTSLPLKDKIDLEQIAAHRGSSFGADSRQPQPTQTTFENRVAVILRRVTNTVVIEDESAGIGRIHLPNAFFAKMMEGDVVWVETSTPERARNIFTEYIEQPLLGGVAPDGLCASLTSGVQRLGRRLGGLRTQEIVGGISAAFAASSPAFEAFEPWITTLLTEYYDKSYQYAFARSKRTIRFKGSLEECRQWILNRYA